MNCPDVERLIDFAMRKQEDPALEEHLKSCGDCRADFLTVQTLAGVGHEDRALSEEMIDKIVAGLPDRHERMEISYRASVQGALAWVLGSSTAALSAIASGAFGVASAPVVFSLVTGMGILGALVVTRIHEEGNATVRAFSSSSG